MSVEDLKDDIHKAMIENQYRKQRINEDTKERILKDFSFFKKAIRGKEIHFDVAKSNAEFNRKHNPFNGMGGMSADEIIKKAMKED